MIDPHESAIFGSLNDLTALRTLTSHESTRAKNAEARWHIAEGELIQIIGRARGVNRTAANPVDVLVLTSTPLPIPVERLITASDIDPSPADVMMAAGGVSFENPADASTSYQQIWATRNAAKKAMEKHREGILGSNRNEEYLITVRPQDRREGPSHVRVDYQLPGHGKRRSTAWVDPHLVSDPEAWLTERLGPLANFALGPANQDAVVVPSLLEIPGSFQPFALPLSPTYG
jgi:putative DNA primase/helicase